jgi:penicillin amidase
MTSSSRFKRRRLPGLVTRVIGLAALLVILIVLFWVFYVLSGMRVAAQTSGTLRAAGLLQPVRIPRDDRDIPHILAANDHDLFFAQGYAEASDRLFQMDLLRRYVYGQLSEVLGPAVLPADEHARIIDIRRIAAEQWDGLPAHQRMELQAFTSGVNEAITAQPLPVEFRILLYHPKPWQPQDTLAVSMATVLDLVDSWDDVIRRSQVGKNAFYSITDPAYDAPIAPRKIAPVPPLPARTSSAQTAQYFRSWHDRAPIGSNEWAVGAAHSDTGRALLANDPHLRLGIPGVWYLVDLRDDQIHVAGASLAGTPGVILGHNDDIAWGATNGTVTTESVYRDNLRGAGVRSELFHVRFGRDVTVKYFRTRHGFIAQTHGSTAFAVDWNADRRPVTAWLTFERLDTAHSIGEALQALRSYPGPPQNFVIADRSGAAAYHLAGLIPDDPLWGLRVHPRTDPSYPFIPFDRLPKVAASRRALVFTANNRMYGAGYPYRLSPNFSAPYRARRIETLLSTQARLSVADFARFQTDTLSIPERDLARETLAALRRKGAIESAPLAPYIAALKSWDGRYDPASRGAAIAYELRRLAVARLAEYNAGNNAAAYESSANNADVVLLMRVLRERPKGWWHRSDYDEFLTSSFTSIVGTYGTKLLEPWGEYARITVRHPLAGLGLSFLNGASFPGDGDSYGLHVQTANHSQSFRAVWDVGNWDAGGIVIPSGESGEPGSTRYADQSSTWIAQRLVPMPFTDAAVRAATKSTLTLTP